MCTIYEGLPSTSTTKPQSTKAQSTEQQQNRSAKIDSALVLIDEYNFCHIIGGGIDFRNE